MLVIVAQTNIVIKIYDEDLGAMNYTFADMCEDIVQHTAQLDIVCLRLIFVLILDKVHAFVTLLEYRLLTEHLYRDGNDGSIMLEGVGLFFMG